MKEELWKTKAYINFIDSLASEEPNPEEVSKKLGLAADVEWAKGDRIGTIGTVTRKANGWEIVSDMIEGAEPAQQVRELLARLENSWPEVCELGKIFEASIELEIWTDGRRFPALTFDPKLLAAVVEMNATIDIDLY